MISEIAIIVGVGVGVGPGLGAALVRRCLSEGVHVVAAARHASRLAELDLRPWVERF